MRQPERIGRLALLSLFFAGAVIVLGKLLETRGGLPFWGGLLAAFGEAAVVGGLADWFAVRALFAHPFGVPFPHTALIPRNRKRIIGEIRDLVEREWLPQSLLISRIRGFDFVHRAVLPAVQTALPHFRQILRDVAGNLLSALDPRDLAELAAKAASRSLTPRQAADFLADLVRRIREHGWLEPVLRELVGRLEQWANSPVSRTVIRARLEQAAASYRSQSVWKELTLSMAELVGGVDLDEATSTIQMELQRFAAEQLSQDSPLKEWLAEGLARLEQRLREDESLLDEVRALLEDSNRLTGLLTPAVASLREEMLEQTRREDTAWLELAMRQVEAGVRRLEQDRAWRDRVNDWSQRLAIEQVERHHSVIGSLVEEQLNRLSEQSLTALIQARVGEDLNWIRLNGTFVGGLIGVTIYLLVTLVRALPFPPG